METYRVAEVANESFVIIAIETVHVSKHADLTFNVKMAAQSEFRALQLITRHKVEKDRTRKPFIPGRRPASFIKADS